jgi:hypothetical protein
MPRRPMRPMKPQPRTPVLSGGRTATVRRNTDTQGLTLRRGDDVLGQIGRVADDTAEWLAGNFSHTPAFSEQAELFTALDAAKAAGDAAKAKEIADKIEKLDIHVHHGGHDMRIDDPLSVSVIKGQVRFRASPAFQILRNGGL